jgi:hypothetical protein
MKLPTSFIDDYSQPGFDRDYSFIFSDSLPKNKVERERERDRIRYQKRKAKK